MTITARPISVQGGSCSFVTYAGLVKEWGWRSQDIRPPVDPKIPIEAESAMGRRTQTDRAREEQDVLRAVPIPAGGRGTIVV
jgi:hypothetical protein